jgi:hypothetical protein
MEIKSRVTIYLRSTKTFIGLWSPNLVHADAKRKSIFAVLIRCFEVAATHTRWAIVQASKADPRA